MTKTISRGLCPVDCGADGLPAALEELARQTRQLFDLDCRFSIQGKPGEVKDTVSVNLFYIAQEAVHNAAKHSGASKIRITLQKSDDRIAVRIQDNGRGLGLDSQTGSGLGIRCMQYRAAIIHGDLQVHPKNGGGTIVECTLTC